MLPVQKISFPHQVEINSFCQGSLFFFVTALVDIFENRTPVLVFCSQVSYENVIAPLANLEAEEFALVQSCVFPALVSTSKEVRDASSEAEKRIDAYNVKCR